MKALMLTPTYEPKVGGTETVVKNLTLHLNQLGVETDVMTFNNPGKWDPVWRWETEHKDGYKVIRVAARKLPFYKVNPLRAGLKLHLWPDIGFRRLLADYDLLHYHDDVDLTFPMFSAFIRKPKLFTYHTLQVTIPYFRANPFVRSFMKRSLDIHLANTKLVEGLIEEIGIEKERIRTSTIGVDTSVFKPQEDIRIGNQLLFVGRFQRWKGLHILLEALDHVETPARLAVIGPVTEPDYAQEIFAAIDRLNRAGRHTVEHLGSITGNALVEWYQKASLFVYPNTYESFGITPLEALSCGTPLIASDLQGADDLITTGKNGILVPAKNARAFAEAIESLLQDPDRRRDYGRAGRKAVEERFAWSAIAADLQEVYRTCLAKS